MNASAAPRSTSAPTPGLDEAFAALERYAPGSPRGDLRPIDDAVAAATRDPTQRIELEARLLATLARNLSPVAQEYVCAKLTMIGSAAAVPALGQLLAAGELATAARTALEAIGGPEAAAELRRQLPRLSGQQEAGAIASLGELRDAGSVPALTALLSSPERAVAAAAIAALGRIATQPAVEALTQLLPRVPPMLALPLADACLAAAEQLLQAGRRDDAMNLYRRLESAEQPAHVRLAARRGLAS